MSKGTEAIEAVKESLKKVAIAAKKISEDKKVGIDDLAHLIELGKEAPAIFASFKGLSEALEEVKDLDVAETISLIQKFHAAVKEIEAA